MDQVEFIDHLFRGTSGYMDITAIHSQRKGVYTRCYKLGQEAPDWDKIAAFNEQGYCIYYGTTTKRIPRQGWGERGKEDTAYMLPILWAEIDLKAGYYPTLEAMHKAVYDLAEPPTVIIHSGGGIHILWRITPIEITSDNLPIIKEVLHGIANHIHGDSVWDLARVMRMPGTRNKKKDRNNALCEVVDSLPGELTFDQFLHYRQYAQPVERPIERELPMLPDGEKGIKLVDWYAANGNVPHQRNTLLNWTAHKLYTDGVSEGNALTWLVPIWCSFGKDEKEGRDTIHSAYTGKRGTPSYINDRGAARMRAGDRLSKVKP